MADSNAARRQSNKKFATPLLDESGFTDGHRRVTRSDQRSIHEGLLNKTIGWEEAREANNAIFASRVAYTRELGLDVDNSALALSNFAKEVESKLQVSSLLYWPLCPVCVAVLRFAALERVWPIGGSSV